VETPTLDFPEFFPAGLDSIQTPAFVYDEPGIHRLLDYVEPVRRDGQCGLLFAIKCFSFAPALRGMAPRLDGLSVSSLFEARLAREIIGGGGSLHLTTPGFRGGEADEIAALCDYVAFNSLSHWEAHAGSMQGRASCGLRVNPQLSFAIDVRYDPCRPQSKLGLPLYDLAAILREDPSRLKGIRGLLIHSNCDSPDFGELRATVARLQSSADGLLRRIEWINLGGGYLFEEDNGDPVSLDGLRWTVDCLRSEYGLQVFMEPGSGLIRAAGYLVSTVLDIFPSGGAAVAVLDTSVNHIPAVFEYGLQPDVVGAVNMRTEPENLGAPHEYLLAGCTCLAGDVFGFFRYPRPLSVGDKVVFRGAGSYTLAKASTFNGVPLPAVYALNAQGELTLQYQYSYAEYAARWGIKDALA